MDAAAALYVAVLNADPLQFDALHSLGVIALQQGRPADAKNFLIKAISVRQDSTDAFYNLGIAFDTLGQYEDAVASYDTALRLRPAYARAFCNRGNSLKKMNLVSEARQSFETALALTPDYPVARLGFGLVALLQGDFAAGWPAYESRWQSADAGVRRYAGPAPSGAAKIFRGGGLSFTKSRGSAMSSCSAGICACWTNAGRMSLLLCGPRCTGFCSLWRVSQTWLIGQRRRRNLIFNVR